MRATLGSGITAAVLILSTFAGADELRTLFPFQADIVADRPGLHRVELPPEVLLHCRPDLSDLRVFDGGERELAYLVQAQLGPESELEVVHGVEAEVLGVEQRKIGGEHRPQHFREIYTLAIPMLPAEASSWELVLESQRREFVRAVDVSVGRNDGWRAQVIEQGSFFRLLQPAGERLRVVLPPVAGDFIVVGLVGEDGSYLQPRFRFEARRSLAGSRASVVSLDVIEQRRDRGKTELVLQRPHGLALSRVRLETSTGAFHRSIEVWDDGPGAVGQVLGRGTVYRIDAIATVEEVEIAIRRPRGDRLRVVIDDRDSPPLEGVALQAMLEGPSLFVSFPEGSVRATLRFGGGRAHRPDYDLAALRTASRLPITGDQAGRAVLLWDPDQVPLAVVDSVIANPAYDPAPALAFAMHPGAAIDPRRFSHRRVLRLKPSQEGLARLGLGPEDLAVSRSDGADLRIIDAQSRQWAYLLEPDAATATVALTLAEHRQRGGISTYLLELPVAEMEPTELILDTDLVFFDREFELRARDRRDSGVSLARGRLKRLRDDSRALVIPVERRRVTGLELIVHDGDDAPISLSRLDIRSRCPDLFVVAPEGEYELLLGYADARPPRYELQRVRSTVLAVASNQVSAGELEDNPSFSLAARMSTGGGLQRTALWVVLVLAAVALAVLTLRLARQESG